jgi:hypothetical protein
MKNTSEKTKTCSGSDKRNVGLDGIIGKLNEKMSIVKKDAGESVPINLQVVLKRNPRF